MLRGPASLLFRLAQRAPLAHAALPLLAAYAPEALRLCGGGAAARGLHVFARATANLDEFCKVAVTDGADVSDLKKAVIAELRLDAAPGRVRLLREESGGGAPVPLDSRRALTEQGVREGSSVLIEVLLPPPPPPLPPPPPDLHYVLVRRGGSLSHSKVAFARGADVDDLKKAIIAELRLDAAPGRVRLLREESGGGAPVPLDSRRALAEQGVREGTSVLIEVILPDVASASPAVAAALKSARRLLAALRVAQLEPAPSSRSSLIRLPEGAFWPQLGTEPLFVRDFYAGLFEGVLGSCSAAAKVRKFIIRGNAGIGKSAFGAYIMWRAVRAGRTVVYASDKVEYCFILHSDGRVEVFDAVASSCSAPRTPWETPAQSLFAMACSPQWPAPSRCSSPPPSASATRSSSSCQTVVC